MRTNSLTRVVALSALGFFSLTTGTPIRGQRQAACTEPAVREEWRTLSDDIKAEYISAVKCLATKPSRLGLDSSLYDDFPWVHSQLNLQIHFVASFLPWHRYFVHLYEYALRNDCAYTGPMPYWDWTLDSGAFPTSPVFSTSETTGFGGTGTGGGYIPPTHVNPLTACLTDGAFAGFNVTYYLNYEQAHCLNRGLNNGTDQTELEHNYMAALYAPAMIANITDNFTTFETFWSALEDTPHGAIHNTLGGDMVPQTSPNDPLFFLHHSQIDRLWWLWQQVDTDTRNADFSGNKYLSPDETPAAPTDVMTFLGLGPNVTVSDVLMTDNDVLCYTYI
ncbi:hypothetical protein F4778DRAFT_731979 [Xylariomycetidae sp. FL2044]|nr:hypothetical protein F4778DRAFT_731979 [Xylariomycetidae sp. FL2044]